LFKSDATVLKSNKNLYEQNEEPENKVPMKDGNNRNLFMHFHLKDDLGAKFTAC